MAPETKTPSNNLWVGNLSSEVTDSDLKDLFSIYGNVHSVTTPNPSRNYAFVYFNRNEDAKAAMKGLRGCFLRGNEIMIDFARPDQKPQSAGNGANQGTLEVEDDKIQRYLSRLQLAAKLLLLIQQEQQQSSNQEGQGSAARFLSTRITLVITVIQGRDSLSAKAWSLIHQGCHKMSLEITPSYPKENRSVDEARRAKEGLQGHLFDDPRIPIMYSSSDVGRSKDYAGFTFY